MLYFLTRCFLCLLVSGLLSSEGAFGDTGLSFSPSSLVPAGCSSPSPGSRSNGKRITETYRQLASHDKGFIRDVSVPRLCLWFTSTAVGPFVFYSNEWRGTKTVQATWHSHFSICLDGINRRLFIQWIFQATEIISTKFFISQSVVLIYSIKQRKIKEIHVQGETPI